jgi:hypothetical protein
MDRKKVPIDNLLFLSFFDLSICVVHNSRMLCLNGYNILSLMITVVFLLVFVIKMEVRILIIIYHQNKFIFSFSVGLHGISNSNQNRSLK